MANEHSNPSGKLQHIELQIGIASKGIDNLFICNSLGLESRSLFFAASEWRRHLLAKNEWRVVMFAISMPE